MQFTCKECGGAELTQEAMCNINTDEIMNYQDSAVYCSECEKNVDYDKIDMPEMTTAGYISRILRAEEILNCITSEEDANPAFLFGLVKKYNKMYNR